MQPVAPDSAELTLPASRVASFGHEWARFMVEAARLSSHGTEKALQVSPPGSARFFFRLGLPETLSLDFLLSATGHEKEIAHRLALFRLPALRSKWERALRRSHFTRLEKLLPWAWVVDPAPVPPGAVIRGLDIICWEDLPLWRGRRDFLLLADDIVRGGLRLDAALSAKAWLEAIEKAAGTSPGAVLVEAAKTGDPVIEASYEERDGRTVLRALRELGGGGSP